MSSVQVEAIGTDSKDIPFQAASLDIWDKKYRLKSKTGEIIDQNIDDTYNAWRAPCQTWRKTRKRKNNGTSLSCGPCVEEPFRPEELLPMPEHKNTSRRPRPSTAPSPARSGIRWTASLKRCTRPGLTLKAGCGIGYEFSTLRPKGAYVSGAGAYTSGPLSFMDIYDKMCFTVSSAGGRRGAQMATFEVGHPDAMDFIRAKREDGRLRQFNCSLLVTDEFMQACRRKRQLAAGVSDQRARSRTALTWTIRNR